MNMTLCVIRCFAICFLLSVFACKGPKTSPEEKMDTGINRPEVNPNPSPEFLTPEESMQRILVPDGYRLELVASEPMIEEPVCIAWDGNGKMYVAEMRTYMQDINGSNTQDPVSRVMLLEDTDDDGKMDKSSVFLDSMMLPRLILPLDDRVLVNETNTYDIHSYRDTDGDGKADEKIPFFTSEEVDKRNLEHQQSGLDWNLDNWIYVGRNPFRFKLKNDKLKIDTLFNAPHSQWGVTHDNTGQLYFTLAGGEIAALGFQQNPHYGNLSLPGELEDFEPWPIIGSPDVERGRMRIREDNTLNRFTGVCGQSIIRGDKCPQHLQGDLLLPEPVGRMIRRAKITYDENGKTILKNAYDKNEFIASTDMNFRPVNTATGPDGCVYIVDMYRGIIQESNWTREGSYIRPQILDRGLDKNIGRGRIYRLVKDGYERGSKPKMLEESTEQLIEYLDHPNGWWRDMAQRLIIIRNDISVVPQLEKIARNEKDWFWQNDFDPIYRIHALWTLEGLEQLTKETLLMALNDEDEKVRSTAIWLAEPFLKAGDIEVASVVRSLVIDKRPHVYKQLIQSLRFDKSPEGIRLLEEIKEENRDKEGYFEMARMSLTKEELYTPEQKRKFAFVKGNTRNSVLKGHELFRQTCSTCHGKDGKGVPTGDGQLLAPSLVGSPRMSGDKHKLIAILLKGLTGPIDGHNYSGVMTPFAQQDDEWIRSVVNYIRCDFGDMNYAFVNTPDVEKMRQLLGDRQGYLTMEELEEIDAR